MKQYTAYKSSGMAWIGDVPGHWDVKAIRYISREVKTGGTPSADSFEDNPCEKDIPWYAPADLKNRLLSQNSRAIRNDSLSDVAIFYPGTVVLIGIGDVGRAALLTRIGTGNQQLNFISPNPEILSNYLLFALEGSRDFTKSCANQTLIPILNQESTKRLRMPLPPIEEQYAIIAYLDKETARIDTLILEKRRLIDKLREYRQATISEVVTKGLDPIVPKKSSGVSWLGEIPAHWNIVSIRRVIDGLATNGVFKKNEDFGEGALLVNVTDLFADNFSINCSTLERVRCSEKELKQYQVCEGDLFLVRSSLKLEGIARLAVAREINEPTVFECHVVRLRPISSLCDSIYMTFFLNASYGRQSLIARSKSTTMTTIDQGEILSTFISIPPLDEQRAIVAYLDQETVRIDN